MFGTERRRQLRTKGNKPGSKGKGTKNNPGYTVSVDQLQSAQKVLITHLSGKIKSAHI